MSKKTIPLAPDLTPEKPKPRLLKAMAIIALGLALAPLVCEGVALCCSAWCEIMGRSMTVRTPILDYIGEHIETARSELWGNITPHFQRVPWNPKVVLPIAVTVMAFAMVLLRL